MASPVRKFTTLKGQKNFTGDYWAATSRSLVGYESWVERNAAMALDFDPAIVALASQPFRLVWPNGGRDREHTPDYFARPAGGTAVVVDVRPENLVDEEAAAVFAFTARICESVGWQFWLVGDLRQPFRANLRRLARYRHPRCCRAPVADRLREVFGEPRRLPTGAERVGDRSAVLPVLYHLLRRHELTADLVSAPLGSGTVVSRAVRGWAHPLTQQADTAAVTTLHRLLSGFFDAREQSDGLGRIFRDYQSWLPTQAWFQFETAEPDQIS